ncbi:nucleotide disphospho-sugar-binding domain-containing protein [Modicisalibacter sp. MOD 31.J]|uniref:nucleotide disphospho-sugar-binding domain-containing protein n=1 Tax=Modicisalibacter sp. MOD 31.J TaxID=2831897 RepID=UPI001CCD7F8C|nr:nucleotide disphospho-sugar-binding domain-containing protein [Modicisalibacter sp. MOD 31.J]MBZ9573737.1 hypothetical protein [Modicisalibacter sp. MOD 31.J]
MGLSEANRRPDRDGVPGGGRRVLLAWEMGEGLGHARRLLTIAEALLAMGWRPVVAAREPAALAAHYRAVGIEVIAAPAHRSCFPGPGRFRAATYADVMGVCGYADREQLAMRVAAWESLLDAWAPAVVIADYAPLLSLAAFGRCPLIAVGDGFVTPPAMPDGGFPPLDVAMSPVWDPALLLASARAVQVARGLPCPETLAEIVTGLGQVVMLPPELDIYHAQRSSCADGPWCRPDPPQSMPYGRRVFAYLRPGDPLARRVLVALTDCADGVAGYFPDATPDWLAEAARHGVVVHKTPPPLSRVLGDTSLLVHHGGIGSMTEAALAGRPQLLLPRHREQRLNARRALEALPGAFVVKADAELAGLRRRLPGLLDDERPARAAHAMAMRLARREATARGALDALLAVLP